MLPPALHPSRSTIAIATPASPPRDLAAFESGIAYLKSLGFNIKRGRLDFPDKGYLSGADELRAEELNAFIRDPEVDAIFCTRGGYGSLRILSLLDFETASNFPKLLVGYSDITALQLAFYKKSGWTSLSGPMVAVEWPHLDEQAEEQFWQMASGAACAPLMNITGEAFNPLKEGSVSGVLLGGNLAVLTKMVGTPYLPSLEGAILFLEDVNEPAHKIDAMLAQLKLSGIWDQLGGLLLGQFTDQENPDHTSPEIIEVFRDYCVNVPFPVASGLRDGHFPIKNAMPIGVQANLTVHKDHAELFILDPLTAKHT